jgi:5-methylthioadenosine/S-adenosylhomocysteine deaminase
VKIPSAPIALARQVVFPIDNLPTSLYHPAHASVRRSHMKTFRLFSFLAFVLCLLSAGAQQPTIALRGTIVTPDRVIDKGTVLISGDKIQAVGASISLPEHAIIIEGDNVISPGLIDLHNHLTWNFLPRWNAGRLFNTRYERQAIPEYGLALSTPHSKIMDEGLSCQTEQYAEVKAIVGGATSVVGGFNSKCSDGLARNLDYYSGLYPPGTHEKLSYEIFPLELSEKTAAEITAGLDNHTLTSFIVHLSEGRPGDANAEREFRMFKARGFLRPGVSIIHGVGLNTADWQQAAKSGVGLIWSPRSNLSLYGRTTDVATAKQAAIKIALAPDWSPSGSDGMLQELKYASVWNDGQYPKVFTDTELVQMATSTPAQLAGLADKIGSIKPGYVADLLVIRRTEKDTYQSLLNASPSDIRLVLIGGNPVYGDDDLMRRLAPVADIEALTVCGSPKALDFSTETALGQHPTSWRQTVDQLNHALNEWGLSPVQLTPCPN